MRDKKHMMRRARFAAAREAIEEVLLHLDRGVSNGGGVSVEEAALPEKQLDARAGRRIKSFG
jgi:hypothetical protein